MLKYDKKTYIDICNNKHNYKYDYSNIIDEFINTRNKIKIICKIHGLFEQKSFIHMNGCGCPKCANNIKYTNDEFISISNHIHNNKYDYSLVNYKNNVTKVKIICPIHGEFEQISSYHLRGCGCPTCSIENKKDSIFISKSEIIHNYKYDYSLVEYNNCETNVKIICPIHGIFEQLPKLIQRELDVLNVKNFQTFNKR